MAKNPSPTNEARIPTGADLRRLLNFHEKRQAQISELSGEMGAETAKMAEKTNLNKKAFGWVKMLINMDPAKMLSVLTHFDHYRTELKIDELAGESLLPETMEEADAVAAAAGKKKKRKKTGKDAAAEQGGGDDEGDDESDEGEESTFKSIGEAGDKHIAEANKRLLS